MHIDIKGICSDSKIKRCKVILVVYFSMEMGEQDCKRLFSGNTGLLKAEKSALSPIFFYP